MFTNSRLGLPTGFSTGFQPGRGFRLAEGVQGQDFIDSLRGRLKDSYVSELCERIMKEADSAMQSAELFGWDIAGRNLITEAYAKVIKEEIEQVSIDFMYDRTSNRVLMRYHGPGKPEEMLETFPEVEYFSERSYDYRGKYMPDEDFLERTQAWRRVSDNIGDIVGSKISWRLDYEFSLVEDGRPFPEALHKIVPTQESRANKTVEFAAGLAYTSICKELNVPDRGDVYRHFTNSAAAKPARDFVMSHLSPSTLNSYATGDTGSVHVNKEQFENLIRELMTPWIRAVERSST